MKVSLSLVHVVLLACAWTLLTGCPNDSPPTEPFSALAEKAAKIGNVHCVGTEVRDWPEPGGGAVTQEKTAVELWLRDGVVCCVRTGPQSQPSAVRFDGRMLHSVSQGGHAIVGYRQGLTPAEAGRRLLRDHLLPYDASGGYAALQAVAELEPAPRPREYRGQGGKLAWYRVKPTQQPDRPRTATQPSWQSDDFYVLAKGESFFVGLDATNGAVRAAVGRFLRDPAKGDSGILTRVTVFETAQYGAVTAEDVKLPPWTGAATWYDSGTGQRMEAPAAVIRPAPGP